MNNSGHQKRMLPNEDDSIKISVAENTYSVNSAKLEYIISMEMGKFSPQLDRFARLHRFVGGQYDSQAV